MILVGLSSLASYTTGQLKVFRHYRHPLRVDRAQIRVLKKPHQVRFRGFLESQQCLRMEPQVRFEVVAYLPHQTLEGKLPNQQLGGFLKLTDLPKCHCPWPVSVRLLYTPRRRGRLPSCLGSQLLSGCLSACRLSRGLLCSSHFITSKLTRNNSTMTTRLSQRTNNAHSC